MTSHEKEAFKAAKPFIRSIVALVVYMGHGHKSIKPIQDSYRKADEFIQQLEDDIA